MPHEFDAHLHELLRWRPRPEPDPALFVLLELLKDDPRGIRELTKVQLELSKEIVSAQVKAIDRAIALVGQAG